VKQVVQPISGSSVKLVRKVPPVMPTCIRRAFTALAWSVVMAKVRACAHLVSQSARRVRSDSVFLTVQKVRRCLVESLPLGDSAVGEEVEVSHATYRADLSLLCQLVRDWVPAHNAVFWQALEGGTGVPIEPTRHMRTTVQGVGGTYG
jgi:hypothetical protein